jgi:hypothetical protein
MSEEIEIKWLAEPEEHNYPAAEAYLSLIFDPVVAAKTIRQLRRAPVSSFKAKDIFRASGLSLLGVSNAHVEKDRGKIASGKKLSPLILVRDPENKKVFARRYRGMSLFFHRVIFFCHALSPPLSAPTLENPCFRYMTASLAEAPSLFQDL